MNIVGSVREMSEDIEHIPEKESDEETVPLEVKVVKEKEIVVEEDEDYIDYDITKEEIKDFEKGD